jgi:hypothetical protein
VRNHHAAAAPAAGGGRPAARRRRAHAQLLRQRQRHAALLQVRGAAAAGQGGLEGGELLRQVRPRWGRFARRWRARCWLARCCCRVLPLCPLRAGWRPGRPRLLRTPALAGLAEHVWTLRELLRFRVPPWPQPAGV